MPTQKGKEQEDQFAPSVTAVLVMVEISTWVAYIDQIPEVSEEGGSAHEAFRRLVARLHQGNYPRLHLVTPTITHVKLVRPGVPL